ncbi:MAG: sodium:solute symporter family transporter, partial [Luteibaculum sp.]
PFPIVAIISIVLIWLYTNKGGIKTIIWTDTFQTVFMLAAICIAFYQIALSLDLNLVEAIGSISESDYSRVFQFEDGNA